jgi:DNA-binding MarR family transcriptional regulator
LSKGSEARAASRTERTAAAVDAVRRLFRALRVAAQRTQSEAGISAAQLFVLSSLANGAASSLTDLGERTHTDRSSVAEVVHRLAASGLVEQFRSERDRRRTGVRITRAGQRLLGRAPRAPTTQLIAGLEALDDVELEGFASGILRLVSHMGLDAEPAPMLFEDETGRRLPARNRVRNG